MIVGVDQLASQLPPLPDIERGSPGRAGSAGAARGGSGAGGQPPAGRRAGRDTPDRGEDGRDPHGRTFRALELASFTHSLVYLALLIAAFAAGKPQPATFALGLTHGVMWIGMSIACLAAARREIIPLRLALAVAVLGGIGPFFGSAEFAREQRRR